MGKLQLLFWLCLIITPLLPFHLFPTLDVSPEGTAFSPVCTFQSPSDYTIGATETFWVEDTWKAFNGLDDDQDGLTDFTDDDYNEAIYSIQTEVVDVTPRLVVFIDQELPIPLYRPTVQQIASDYSIIASTVESTLAAIPDRNSDERVILIITDIRDEAYYFSGAGELIAGFFWPVHSTPPTSSGISQYSHDSEIIYLDKNPIASGDVAYAAEILSHELQHLVQFAYHPDQDLWLDEGLSVYTEVLCGYSEQVTTYQNAYAAAPFRSLLYFDQSLAAYGMSSLFVYYLAAHFGEEVLAQLYKESTVGMWGVINALEAIGYPVTSSELFINFSLAHWLETPTNFSSLDLSFPTPDLMGNFPTTKTWMIPSWSHWVRTLAPVGSSQAWKLTFATDTPWDSFNQPALFYVTLAQESETQILSMTHWLMDPITGDNVFLTPSANDSITQSLLMITAYAGSSGGPLPTYTAPLCNGSLTVEIMDASNSFSFPGYLTLDSEDQELIASGVRYYASADAEWTNSNTYIAKWRLLREGEGDISTTGKHGDLYWTPAGWSTPIISLDDLSAGTYLVEYEFFNGSLTTTFHSEIIDLSESPPPLIESLSPLIFLCFLLGIVGIAIYVIHRKQVRLNRETPVRLTKLKPLFRDEKKSVEEVKEEVFRKYRR